MHYKPGRTNLATTEIGGKPPPLEEVWSICRDDESSLAGLRPGAKGTELMKANIGSVDRGVRVLLGLGVIGAGVVFQSWLGAVGLVLLGTAAISTCPIYLPFGISTRGLGSKVRAQS